MRDRVIMAKKIIRNAGLGMLAFAAMYMCVGCTLNNIGTEVNNEEVESNINNEIVQDNKKIENVDEAISKALIEEDDYYIDGECNAEGHILLDEKQGEEEILAYALVTQGEYGFENGTFVKIAGSGVIPTKFIFDKEYNIKKIERPEDGSRYNESLKKLFPYKLLNDIRSIKEETYDKCLEQEFNYAKNYLESINRKADVKDKVDHKLAEIKAEASNQLLDMYNEYPYFIGTIEKIENGERYVYETKFEETSEQNGIISYVKYKYDTNEVLEEDVIEVNGKELTYKKGNPRKSKAN